eukprot:gene9255-16943_t
MAQAFERSATQLESLKNKLTEENADVKEKLAVLDRNCSDLTKTNKNLEADLMEQKSTLKIVTKARDDFIDKYEDIKVEFTSIQNALEDEQEAHVEAKRRLTDVTNNYDHLKHLYEVEALQKIEELEDAKRKLAIRVREVEDTINELQGKLPGLEKAKARLSAENAELTDELERTHGDLNLAEKACKKMDHELHDLRGKHELIVMEFQNGEKLWKETSAQLNKTRQKHEDACAELEILKRENKKLRDDLESLKEEIIVETAKIKELDAAKRRVEIEYEAVTAILEELEITVDEEKMNTQRSIAELNLIINELEEKLGKRDEELDSIRRVMQLQLNDLGEKLENEVRNKSEQARQRKKYEDLSIDLEGQVDRLNATNADLVRINKKISQDLKDFEMRYDDERLNHDNTMQSCQRAEKKLKEATKALNDAKLDLEQAERMRKVAQTEVDELTARSELLQAKNTEMTFSKQKVEKDLNSLKIDFEDAEDRAKLAEEKAKRVLGEFDKLNLEMKQVQDQAAIAEVARESSERQVRELQRHIDEMERVGVRQLKNEIRLLERKIFEVEEQLGEERRSLEEMRKLLSKAEKRNRALESVLEDERKASEILHVRNEGLNAKLKKMREAVETSETEIASLVAKYRKCQAELEDAEDRADVAHSALLMRTKTPKSGRSRAMTPVPRSRARSRALSPEPRDYRDYESSESDDGI